MKLHRTFSALETGRIFFFSIGLLTSSVIAQHPAPCERTWTALGTGLPDIPPSPNDVWTMAIFDDGTGPALFVGGRFTTVGGQALNRIAKWDGASWTSLGTGLSGPAWAMKVFDDGSGPALFVGGFFEQAGGKTVNSIAKWDGNDWHPLGSGIIADYPWVYDIEVFDDGSGPSLYIAGDFITEDTEPIHSVARWDGQQWSQVGDGLGDIVNTLVVFDDGSGPALFAGGDFAIRADPANIAASVAKWNGSEWQRPELGARGLWGHALALEVFDDGTGSALYAAGFQVGTTGIGQENRIVKWDGSQWSPVRDSVPTISGFQTTIYALKSFDDGHGEKLYVGGFFTHFGHVETPGIAKWDGVWWSGVGDGLTLVPQPPGAFSRVRALLGSKNDGAADLFAGGNNLENSTTLPSRRGVARWGCIIYCPADLNQDGQVNFFDVSLFVRLFLDGDPAADINQDGMLDFNDFAAFLDLFATPCAF